MNETIINIDWNGPYTLNDLSDIQDDNVDYGVYQIYGAHPIYGAEKLLYIGKADKQTFGTRISQEGWDSNSDANGLKIYVGWLTGKIPTEEQWSKEISLAEKLLIYSHKPAYNSQSIKQVNDKDLLSIHVLNWGKYRDLMPEVSGMRWTSKFELPRYQLDKVLDLYNTTDNS
ncbi:hypothetical protein [Sporomusa sp. KB1]|jgi:hypothetical protein|uniref:hypothetical protein n=1 Tax=Sporomusa sp. KB1 TaxID=943346 RepID=UPI0011A34B81|nr:hypothetical protein [Sporomusa sp. KB1]TWH48571.1 hypothetical protein Salpa_4736 [Sporomusa sp. KB1]